jgi:hypothetical protein
MIPPRPPSDADQPQPGSFREGCGIGFLVQLSFLVLAIAGAYSTNGQTAVYILSSFGLAQWLAILPMMGSQKSKGQTQTSNGLFAAGMGGVIVGSILFLLGSACGPSLFGFS